MGSGARPGGCARPHVVARRERRRIPEPTLEVMRILREQRILHLPVLRRGRLVGIITLSDVVRYIAREIVPLPREAG